MKFEQATLGFERAIQHLQNNLQYLVNQDKVSTRFVNSQNQVLKSLISYQQSAEQLLDDLQLQVHELSGVKHHEYKRLLDRYQAMEAICLLHGIVDYRLWLSRGKRQLIAETLDYDRNRYLQLPYRLLKLLDPLSQEDKALFFDLLQKGQPEIKANGIRT